MDSEVVKNNSWKKVKEMLAQMKPASKIIHLKIYQSKRQAKKITFLLNPLSENKLTGEVGSRNSK